MATSKDSSKMMTFGEAERWAFKKMAHAHPDMAQMWLDKIEAGKWHNYMSHTEAEMIASNFVNQNGSRGPHWNYETFKAAVESLGASMSDEPYYNCYALWVVANMHYSDHAASVAKYVPKEDFPKFFYEMAVESLKDPDKPHFIRDYFDE